MKGLVSSTLVHANRDNSTQNLYLYSNPNLSVHIAHPPSTSLLLSTCSPYSIPISTSKWGLHVGDVVLKRIGLDRLLFSVIRFHTENSLPFLLTSQLPTDPIEEVI